MDNPYVQSVLGSTGSYGQAPDASALGDINGAVAGGDYMGGFTPSQGWSQQGPAMYSPPGVDSYNPGTGFAGGFQQGIGGGGAQMGAGSFFGNLAGGLLNQRSGGLLGAGMGQMGGPWTQQAMNNPGFDPPDTSGILHGMVNKHNNAGGRSSHAASIAKAIQMYIGNFGGGGGFGGGNF